MNAPVLPRAADATAPAAAASRPASFAWRRAADAATPPPSPRLAAGAPPPSRSPLRDIEGARARLDALLDEARRGRTFSPAELISLQADAHRFAQTVELAARAVEHGVQGLRQAVQAQV